MIYPTKIGELSRYEREVGGWIDQSGTFYQACYGCHNDVASRIVETVFGDQRYYNAASEYLIGMGWIRLETDGIIHHPIHPTEQQANILYHFYARADDDSDYKEELYKHIAVTVLEVAHAKEPMPRVPAQGDQENYHWTQARAWKGVYA